MKKHFIILFFLLFLTSAAHAQLSYDELKKVVIGMNAQMPMSTGYSMQINSVSLVNNEMVYYCSLLNIGKAHVDEKTIQDNAKYMLCNCSEDVKSFLQNLIDLNIDLVYNFGYNSGLDNCKLVFSPQDMKTIINYEFTPTEKLNLLISTTKGSLPMQISEGIKIVGFDKVDGFVEWTYEVDETLYDINSFVSNQETIKENVHNTFANDMISLQQVKIFVESNHGLKYTYRGNMTKQSFCIIYTIEELSELPTEK